MNIFIVKLFTKGTEEYEQQAQEYCFENNRVAIGWGLRKDMIIGDETSEELVKMNIEYNYKYSKESLSQYKTALNNLNRMRKGDFVWTQNNDGRSFKLGKITDETPFIDQNNLLIGLTRCCAWCSIDFNDVPGEVINSYQRKNRTLIMKHNLGNFEEYFNYLYLQKKPKLSQKLDYKKLLHYDDLEDLLGIYLQKHKDFQYYIFPSSNKISTKLIEFELRREVNGEIEKACVQCKTGKAKVEDEFFNVEEFKDYHIYITTMIPNDNYDYDKSGKRRTNVTTIPPYILWEWAKKNRKFLPGRIQKYIDICE